MPTYELVNPYVIGDMKTSFNTSSSKSAANEAWSALSKYITNNVPKFAFTIKKLSDNKLYHFVVKEKLSKSKKVSFTIKELNLNMSKEEENKFSNYVSNLENQAGGKKKHNDDDDSSDSSDSDSSDDDLIRRVRQFKERNSPLKYMWYSPMIYSKDGNLTSVYVPSFVYPVVPYLELSMSTIFFKY